MARKRNSDFVKDIKLSAGHVKNRGACESELLCTTEHVNNDPFSSRSSDVKLVTKYFIYCQAKCDFNLFGFCTCVAGRCFKEENELKPKGMDTRVIINLK